MKDDKSTTTLDISSSDLATFDDKNKKAEEKKVSKTKYVKLREDFYAMCFRASLHQNIEKYNLIRDDFSVYFG